MSDIKRMNAGWNENVWGKTLMMLFAFGVLGASVACLVGGAYEMSLLNKLEAACGSSAKADTATAAADKDSVCSVLSADDIDYTRKWGIFFTSFFSVLVAASGLFIVIAVYRFYAARTALLSAYDASLLAKSTQ
jgi:hypothetical protein